MTEERLSHSVLIVDDDKGVAKSLLRLFHLNRMDAVVAESGDEGEKRLHAASTPFAVILTDQRMPKMNGTDFLEIAKKIHPHTFRFLLTAHSDMETVINAINRGAVHRYFVKPWDETQLLDAVKMAFFQYEKILENERLLRVAKKQHKQLNQLENELIKLTRKQFLAIKKQEHEIQQLEAKIMGCHSVSACHPDQLILEMEKVLLQPKGIADEDDGERLEALQRFYRGVIREIFNEFDQVAQRNGFEMPLPCTPDREKMQ